MRIIKTPPSFGRFFLLSLCSDLTSSSFFCFFILRKDFEALCHPLQSLQKYGAANRFLECLFGRVSRFVPVAACTASVCEIYIFFPQITACEVFGKRCMLRGQRTVLALFAQGPSILKSISYDRHQRIILFRVLFREQRVR